MEKSAKHVFQRIQPISQFLKGAPKRWKLTEVLHLLIKLYHYHYYYYLFCFYWGSVCNTEAIQCYSITETQHSFSSLRMILRPGIDPNDPNTYNQSQ